MTLDEAIAHHKWAVENSQGVVRAEHEQHVKWLTIAKMATEGASKDRLYGAAYSLEIARNELMERDCLQFAEENDRLRDENAKLRELVKAMEPFLCCMPFASCNTLAANVRHRMSELGIEVDQ